MNSGRSVAFLTRDFSPGSDIPGGCSYYRCMLPMQASGLRAAMGLPAWTAQTGFGVMLPNDRAQFGYNVVVLKLLMERSIPYQIRVAQELGQKIIVDVDDHYDDLPESNMAFRATSAERSTWSNREHYRESILAADAVTVTTQFLFDYYSKLRDNVFLVRNGVLPEQFTVRKVRNRKPVIGWIGGIPWRGGELEDLRAWLPDLLERHDLMFHHSGHTDVLPGTKEPVQSFAEVAGVPRERITYSELKPLNEYYSMFTFDIGLVPLKDIPFNHAKSTLKGLEYSASNIPFVAQSLPEYQRLSDLGVGRVANSPDEWVAQVEALLDFKIREREARLNRERVIREHSIYARAQEWHDIFSSV